MSLACDHAGDLLKRLKIESLPIDPYGICERLGILVKEDDCEGYTGMLLVVGKDALISVKSSIREQSRKRFTVAHELGHYNIPEHLTSSRNYFKCTDKDLDAFTSKGNLESEANDFAAEFLMPRFIYQELVSARKPGWDSIKELALLSQTSLTSTAIKFIDLTDHACALIVSERGMINWFHKSKEFNAYVQMEGRLVSPGTITYSAFRGSAPPDCFEAVKADNWLSGRGVKSHTEILEWSLPINSYGQVLTLLFDEEGIQGWGEDDFEDDDDEVKWDPPTFHKSKRKK